MTSELVNTVCKALDDLKAQNIVTLDVMSMSEVMDTLVIASGTSSRHVKSLASNVVDEAKKQELNPVGIEGLEAADWVLVDYGSVVVHVMLPQARKFYDLEKLWSPIERAGSASSDEFGMPNNSDASA
ncbi:MAG: ribosome-associated protein [Cellvibrionaceae bacterium]|jgi:ribosome-associated protein